MNFLPYDSLSPYLLDKKWIVNSEGHAWPSLGANIAEAFDELPIRGGKVWLPPLQFDLEEDLEIPAQCTLKGCGRENTVLNQTGNGENVITALGTGVKISDIGLELPTVNSGHGIESVDNNRLILRDLHIIGVDPTHYAIRYENGFLPDWRNLRIITSGFGIGLISTGGGFNYGNGAIDNVNINMLVSGNNTVGFHVLGRSTELQNLMRVGGLYIVTGSVHDNTMTGILMEYGRFFEFHEYTIEGTDVGIDLENSSDNTFIQKLIQNINDFLIRRTGATRNVFIGGQTDVAANITITGLENVELFGQSTFIGIRNSWRLWRWQTCDFYDDFVGAALDARWNVAAGAATLQNITWGEVRLTTGALTNNTAQLDFGGNRPYRRDWHIAQEFKARRVEATAQDVFLGIADGGFAAANHAAGWYNRWNQGNWQTLTCDGVVQNMVDSGISRSATRHTFRVEEDTAAIRFFYDGDVVATHTTNLPSIAVDREPLLYIRTNEDVEKNMDVDFVYYATGRPTTP